MAFGWVSKLTGFFGLASKDVAPTTIDITTSELFDVLKPVLEDPQRKHDLISVDIDKATQHALKIIASSKCDYTNDIHDFRNALSAISKDVPALSTPDQIITIPISTLQTLMTSKAGITDVTSGLDNQSSFLTQPVAEILPFNEVADHFEFFAAKESLTDAEIDSMRNSILRLDDSLSTFARKHDIRSPSPTPPSGYEPTSYS